MDGYLFIYFLSYDYYYYVPDTWTFKHILYGFSVFKSGYHQHDYMATYSTWSLQEDSQGKFKN